MVKETSKVGEPGGDRPGKELPKDYRVVALELVDNQGWRYERGRSGHPKLYSPDRTKSPVVLSGTPGDRRDFRNTVAEIRRRGGVWPPPK